MKFENIPQKGKKILKNAALTAVAAVGLTTSSCDTCKHIPSYGGRAAMTYGHDADKGFNLNKSKTPYAPQKTKKPKSSGHNPYKTHWWDSR